MTTDSSVLKSFTANNVDKSSKLTVHMMSPSITNRTYGDYATSALCAFSMMYVVTHVSRSSHMNNMVTTRETPLDGIVASEAGPMLRRTEELSHNLPVSAVLSMPQKKRKCCRAQKHRHNKCIQRTFYAKKRFYNDKKEPFWHKGSL